MDKSRLVSTLILGTLATVGSVSQAIHEPIYAPLKSCFDGLYIGVGAGGVWGDFHRTTSTRGLVSPLSSAYTSATLLDQHESHPNHFLGTAFIGFGNTIGRIYDGIELWVTQSGHSSTRLADALTKTMHFMQASETIVLSNTTQYKLHNFEGGIDGKLGWLLTPTTLLYGKAGIGFNEFKLMTTSSVRGSSNTLPLVETGSLSYGAKKNIDYRFGAGLEQHFSPHWSLRADYTFTHYGWLGNFKSVIPSPTARPHETPADVLTSFSRASLNNSAVLLSILYTFN